MRGVNSRHSEYKAKSYFGVYQEVSHFVTCFNAAKCSQQFNAIFRYSTLQVKEKEQALVAARQLEVTRKELEHAKQWKGQLESAQSKILELELEIKELKEELRVTTVERDDSRKQSKTEKEQLDEVSIWSYKPYPLCSVYSLLNSSRDTEYSATAPPHVGFAKY